MLESGVPTVSLPTLVTFYIRHNEHLGLGKPLLEVVEVDCTVKGYETNLRPCIPWKPEITTTSSIKHLSITHQTHQYSREATDARSLSVLLSVVCL